MICAFVIPLASIVMKTRPEDMGLHSYGKESLYAFNMSFAPHIAPEGLSLKQALFTSSFWLTAGTFALSQVGVMGTHQSQVPHLQDIGFPVTIAATILGGVGLMSAISKLSFGWLCDRINPKYACILGIIFEASGTLILMYIMPTSPHFILWLYVLVFGLGAGNWLPIMSTFVSRNFGLASYGSIFGATTLALNLGASTGPLIAGFLYDTMNTYFWAFTIFMGLYVISVLMIIGVRRPMVKSS